MNIFERASRLGLVFETERGPVSTEHLWSMPLTSRDGFDLDTTARSVHKDLTEISSVSFVSDKPSLGQQRNELRLSILKHI